MSIVAEVPIEYLTGSESSVSKPGCFYLSANHPQLTLRLASSPELSERPEQSLSK